MSSLLPGYVSSAKPLPVSDRVPWYRSAAPAYAGVMLWVVFWQDIATAGNVSGDAAATAGGTLATGLTTPILAIIVAALICHFGSYLAPGLMGQKTGLSLAVVGTSTYGTTGGFLMPGFFMGVLQFGWLGVNAWFSAMLLANTVGCETGGVVHITIGVLWAIFAAFIGLKGIQYVAKVSTYLPVIPWVILVVLFLKTVGGLGGFDPAKIGVTVSPPLETATIIPADIYAQV
ncbi:MAG: hypothetical protein Q4C47_09655, partial [Planctomycetia bacterium]|nr:hypothetical protein [Planctomycetia bacterium]